MLFGSDYFYGQLLESQKQFARAMNHKTGGNYFKVLRSYRTKLAMPMKPSNIFTRNKEPVLYEDLALHKVIEEEFGLTIAKATVSEWINRVPTLLENKDELNSLLDESNKIKEIKKDEKKYTLEEWEYIHKLKGEQLNVEFRTMMAKLENPKLSGRELMKITGATQSLINKINNYGVIMSSEEKQKEFISMTEQIMLKGQERLLREIELMPTFKMQDLKALSGIVDDTFKQNRLLTGQSTENVAHGLDDIYEAILNKQETGIKNIEENKIIEYKKE